MAQSRVTDHFQTRKRKADFHSSKRQKLHQNGTPFELTTNLPETSTNSSSKTDLTESESVSSQGSHFELRIPSSQQEESESTTTTTANSKKIIGKKKTKKASTNTSSSRTRSKKNTAATTNKSSTTTLNDTNPNIVTCSNQITIVQALGRLAESGTDAPTNKGKSITKSVSTKTTAVGSSSSISGFTFKKSIDLPSDGEYVVTDYDADDGSPQTTPTKRSAKASSAAVSAKKRKRTVKANENLYHTPKHEPETMNVQNIGSAVRKRLELPSNTMEKLEPVNSMSATQVSSGKEDVKSMGQLKSKKPTAAEMKKMLAKCGKLAELKNCLQKVKEITDGVKVKPENGKKSSHKQSNENKAKPSTPAYQKYKDLAVAIPPSLTLPFKYRLLENMFRGCDTVISIMHNRMETCTFDKLKNAVQEMLRKNFEPRHLGQIKAVYPESYEIRQEKGIVVNGVRASKHLMTIEANLDLPKEESSSDAATRKDGRAVFSTADVLHRKTLFRNKLFAIVKDHHQRFLNALTTPVKVDHSQLKRWHPKFLVDEVPDIEAADLPQPPVVKEMTSAKQVLEMNRSKLPSRVEQALAKVAAAKEAADKLKKNSVKDGPSSRTCETSQQPSNKTSTTNGVSNSLLERIRAKEAAKAAVAMTRDLEAEEELHMLQRLPEIIKIIRSFFVTEKKPALLEDSVIVKLCDSYKSALSQTSAEKHIQVLLKYLPDWISKVTVSKGNFIKINRASDITLLNKKITSLIKAKEYGT